MKKIIPFIAIFLVLFTGCIEIVEEIKVNEDKSGTMTYKIETDELGVFINMISGMMDESFDNKIRLEFEKYTRKLRGKPGISNISYNYKDASEDYYISFDFASDKHLNAALYDVLGIKENIFTPTFIKIKRSKLKKLNYAPWVKRYIDSEGIEIPTSYFSNLVTQRSVVSLSQKIKKASGESVQLSGDRKISTQQFDIQNIIENKTNVGLKLKY